MPATAESRILGSIVKHIQEKEEDPLTPLIDEYLIKRIKPEYAHLRLKKITLDVTERPRPAGRLSPSSVGGCERQAAFTFLGVKGRKRVDPDTELIFTDGHWRHHKWQTMFKEMELILGRHRFRLISIEEPIILGPLFVAGTLDAVVKIKVRGKWRRYVIDIKGSNNWAFEAAYRNRAPDPKYVKQLLTYMRAKKCKRGILLYDSKDKNKFYVFTVLFTDKEWGEIRRWCRSVIEQVEEKKLPPKHPDCNNGNFLYGRCPFRRFCFGDMDRSQVRRIAYKGFTSVDELWEEGKRLVEEHEVQVP